MTDKNRYDAVPYPSKAYAYAHPDRMWVMAKLFGLVAPSPERARVLEIGCGAGGHLLPMAAALPHAELVGIDLSQVAIDEALEWKRRAGLSNVSFRRANVLDIESLGSFDYIIAHGVYSWVPAPVRDAILDLCRRSLTPQGVAYISYNTYPGWHLRGVMRDIMRFHGERFEEPMDQVTQGLSMVSRFAAQMALGKHPYGAVLAREMAGIHGHTPGYYFHDLLAPINDPVLFRDFVTHIRAHGLGYLGEVALEDMMPRSIPDGLARELDEITSDIIELQQYYDLARGTGFRRSLLCTPRSEDAPLDRELSWRDLDGVYITMSGSPAEGTLNLHDDEPATFVTRGDQELKVGGHLAKAALIFLFTRQPCEVSFEELVQGVGTLTHLGEKDGESPEQQMGAVVLHAFRMELVDLSPRRRGTPPAQPERPEVFPLVREMAADGMEHVPNLRNEMVAMTRMDRVLIGLSDGSRDLTALVDGMVEAVLAGELTVKVEGVENTDPEIVREAMEAAVPARLRRLYEASILIGVDLSPAA